MLKRVDSCASEEAPSGVHNWHVIGVSWLESGDWLDKIRVSFGRIVLLKLQYYPCGVSDLTDEDLGRSKRCSSIKKPNI